MPLALIISSHVAASHVGGTAQASALSILRIDAMVAPTVLYGRHPGWGPPGGAKVEPAVLEGVLAGIEANKLFGQTDLVLTGYFAFPEQVLAAAAAIDAVRGAQRSGYGGEAPRAPTVIVDPTIGDFGKGLYVPDAVAQAIAEHLVPRADILAPNAWELAHLTGLETRNAQDVLVAARRLGKPALVSSIGGAKEIGVIYVDPREAWMAAHPRLPSAPKGTGDLLSALFGAAILDGLGGSYALARAVGGVAETVAAAHAAGAAELPIVAMAQRLKATSPSVRLERLA
ncbi:MAG: bifunctional hydroxymethylpyrimidine kinase/phosphomethylpyrimidine kinase [Phenylobacterium sp.]|nr:bifunctional hydroxymethylpyrimidine kinase/phosphomethylpyrimidine kinase [Phenylobacterium sp.]